MTDIRPETSPASIACAICGRDHDDLIRTGMAVMNMLCDAARDDDQATYRAVLGCARASFVSDEQIIDAYRWGRRSSAGPHAKFDEFGLTHCGWFVGTEGCCEHHYPPALSADIALTFRVVRVHRGTVVAVLDRADNRDDALVLAQLYAEQHYDAVFGPDAHTTRPGLSAVIGRDNSSIDGYHFVSIWRDLIGYEVRA